MIKYKFLWGSLITVLLLFAPYYAYAGSFPDVEEGTVHHNAIEYLKNKGVIEGYSDGTFKPDQTINRAEALKMVMVIAGVEIQDFDKNSFPDVSEGEWFYEFVQKGLKKGIVEGYPDGTFKPANNINYAESLKIILLAFEKDVGEGPDIDPYPDVSYDEWYSPYADYCKGRQFVEPFDDGKLYAGRDITREEFSQIIYRLMYTEENGLDKFPLSTDWLIYNHPEGDYSIKVPYTWKIVEAGDQTIFWKTDDMNDQLSWARVYPYSATAVIAVDPNEEGTSLSDYFVRIEYDDEAVIKEQTLNSYPFASVYLPSTNTSDYYFVLPNGKILVIYSQIGNGENRYHLSEIIRYMAGSLRHGSTSEILDYVQVTSDEKFLSEVRGKILVEGEGQSTMDRFNDLVIIETDTIGIGTGPIDYYYSASHNITLKYERYSDTILALTEEKSTAF